MKKYIFMAAAAMTLAACSSSDEESVTADEKVELRLTSGLQVEVRSNTQAEQIASGEKVVVWVNDAGNSNALYKANTLTADGSGNLTDGTTMYFPSTGNNVDVYAIHGNGMSFTTDEAFPTSAKEFTVAADQSSTSNYTNSDLLYAYTKSAARNGIPTTIALKFYHMLSKIGIAIKAGESFSTTPTLTSVTIGNEDVIVNGTFTPSTTADMTTQSNRASMLTAAGTSSKGTITLSQNISTDFTDNINYNEAIIVPQDMAGKVLAFKLQDGGTLQYKFPNNTKFESGKKYLYQITLNLTGLKVTSSIEDWGSVGPTTGSAEMP